MNFLCGTFFAAIASFLMLSVGYGVAGFLTDHPRAVRLALGSLIGLGWVVWVASVLGAVLPLHGPLTVLAWAPVLVTLALPRPRQCLRSDLAAVLRAPTGRAGLVGLAVLWVALLLPFLVFPDLVLFDGKTNHDNFFWCVGAEYLQQHDYLTIAPKQRDHPLFNLTWSFSGWHPVWARMAAEGYVALVSATFGRGPIALYNFLVSALALPWVLVTFALARHLGLPRLPRLGLAFVMGCQPILFFFVANGNTPNLLGTLFSGGLWLVALLLLGDRTAVRWPLLLAGIFFLHGILAAYPEILIFALAPIGLLVLREVFTNSSRRFGFLGLIAVIVAAGLCLNPVTTVRLWSGIENSIGQARQDSGWANIFSRVTWAGYLPSLVTLGVPSIRLYGAVGGFVASVAFAISLLVIFRDSRRRQELFFPLVGFLALLGYTIATDFGYGWQKSVQFYGIPLAVLFPVLLAGAATERWRQSASARLALAALLGSLGVMLHCLVGVTLENLKSANHKALTRSQLALTKLAAREFPGEPVYIDGATFRAAFFQSMWGAYLFPANPLVFISRQKEAGGYLRDFVTLDNPTTPPASGRFYVGAAWARAFDYDAAPATGRVGVVLKEHNLVSAFRGFYRPVGVPEMCEAKLALTIHPYAAGWLEFELEPTAPTPADCELVATVTTPAGTQTLRFPRSPQGNVVARFPLQAGVSNEITAEIIGAPAIDPLVDDPPYPFRIVRLASQRLP